jgi:hypothetical protein
MLSARADEKSDSVIVAAKPANKAERSAAELVEPRAETKGNAGWQSTLRTQSGACVSQALIVPRRHIAFTVSYGINKTCVGIARKLSQINRPLWIAHTGAVTGRAIASE